MSFNVALPANTSQISLSAGYIRNNNTGIQTALSTSTLTGNFPYIPTGGPLAVYFYANAAPSGWTLVGAVTDCLLAVKDASVPNYATGGVVGGSWDTGGYQLLGTDIPVIGAAGPSSCIVATLNTTTLTNNPHKHTWSTTRPKAAVGILCTKDA